MRGVRARAPRRRPLPRCNRIPFRFFLLHHRTHLTDEVACGARRECAVRRMREELLWVHARREGCAAAQGVQTSSGGWTRRMLVEGTSVGHRKDADRRRGVGAPHRFIRVKCACGRLAPALQGCCRRLHSSGCCLLVCSRVVGSCCPSLSLSAAPTLSHEHAHAHAGRRTTGRQVRQHASPLRLCAGR